MRKLSEAQITALNDIANGHYAAPKPNTVESLLKRELIREVRSTTGGFDTLELTDAGREAIGLPVTPVEAEHPLKTFSDLLDGTAREMDRAGDVAKLTGLTRREAKANLFGAWAGLSDQEILDDLATAKTVPNRKDRRDFLRAVKASNRATMRRFGRRVARFGSARVA